MAKDSGTVNIHGKEYTTVAKRVQDFRNSEETGTFTIETELVERTDTDVVMKAIIRNEEGRIIATGYAEEQRSASMINKTSALENCETSAIGRALAAFGLAGTEYASADEVAQAIHEQKQVLKTERTANTDTETSGGDQEILARAKATINKELEKAGYETPASKQAFIRAVLKKSTIDDLNDCDAVADALDNESIDRDDQEIDTMGADKWKA